MARLLWIVSLAAIGCVVAAEIPYFSFGEAFTPSDGQDLEVGYRAYTAPTLSAILAGGVRVELNGELQGPFGPSGIVARDIVLRHEEE